MPHEPRYRDDDPILHRLRELAFSFPRVGEKLSHGRPAFFTTKVFAWYGMSNTGTKRLHHPVVGAIELSYESLELSADPGLKLSTYTAEPNTPSTDACPGSPPLE